MKRGYRFSISSFVRPVYFWMVVIGRLSFFIYLFDPVARKRGDGEMNVMAFHHSHAAFRADGATLTGSVDNGKGFIARFFQHLDAHHVGDSYSPNPDSQIHRAGGGKERWHFVK